jgi:nucleoside-diphosphate-sugar epimerase
MTNNRSRRILVTGALGQIGSELVPALRNIYPKKDVVASDYRKTASEEVLSSGPFEYLDTTDEAAVGKVCRKHDIDTVYHLAGILSAVGERNPTFAWHVNMDSLHNVLEVAKEMGMNRVFWPSSIAVFGPEVPKVNTPQDSPLVPRTVYGITKVAGELLCHYYFSKHGLDARSIRFPGIISSETLPGGGTTDYAVEIFYEALRRKRYKCFVRKETILPMLYMPDCIKATLSLMDADSSQLSVRTSYNLMGPIFSAEELATEIEKYIPEFACEYKPDFREEIAESWPSSVDDAQARKDWGWSPEYDLPAIVKDMLERLSQKLS